MPFSGFYGVYQLKIWVIFNAFRILMENLRDEKSD